ncbi:hypothetical protein ACFQ0B_30070 [Nonomuraea thailandensis]
MIIAQLRSVVVDLLQATGMEHQEATAALTPLDGAGVGDEASRRG